MPDVAKELSVWMASFAALSILYGAVMTLMQTDLKRLIAYSSVSHMGFVMLGVFVFNVQGLQGAVFQMVSHGITTGALFLLDGVIYERIHDRPIAHMTAYVPPGFEDIRGDLHEEGVSVYRLVEERYGRRIAEAQQQVEAIGLPPEIAVLLGAEPGEPALRVARSYLDGDGRLLTASVNVHPKDRFSLVTGWRLDWQPGPVSPTGVEQAGRPARASRAPVRR